VCGIAGVLRLTGVPDADDVAAVLRMLDAQTHRGPDDWGLLLPASTGAGALPARARDARHARTYADDGRGPGAVLGARRLSILDLSPRGRMPMGTADGRLWIVDNGEVYNYRQLRRELAEHAPFQSGTDTEVVLRGWAAWGAGAIERLRGMFAFAVFEARPRARLSLVRDRLGIKPLYYYLDRERVIFASEVRALRHSRLVPDELAPAAIVRFLQLGTVPSPGTTVKGVMSLPAGHCLTVDGDGRAAARPYWQLGAFAPRTGAGTSAPGDEGDASSRAAGGMGGSARSGGARAAAGRAAAGEVRRLLDDSIRLHLVSDVPLGVFLSGGIDSSSLVALAARERPAPLITLSVGFDEPAWTEITQARLVARRFGTDHREVRLAADQLFDALPAFFRAMDDPTIDGVNTYVLAGAARRAGLTVVLSGTGGDEVFWGYGHLRRAALLERAGRAVAALPGPARRGLGAAARWSGAVLGRPGLDRLEYFERPSPSAVYLAVRGLYGPAQVADLLGIGTAELRSYGPPLGDEAERADGHALALQEFRHYLGNQLLRDTDLFSMAHSVEARVPLLDHRLVEHVAALPAAVRVAGGPHKPLLRRAMGDLLPRESWDRPKMGFTFPFAPWLRRRAGELRAQSLEGGRLDARAVGRAWDAFEAGRLHWSRAWALVVLSRFEAERAKETA
jgi:asparagine synthase (glutamine-hydrolysing)